jgi:hypothetical protein
MERHWVPVDKVEKVQLDTAVYDLTVEGGAYFVEGVCVHNCPHEIVTDLEGVPDCADLWRGGTLRGLGPEEWAGKERQITERVEDNK